MYKPNFHASQELKASVSFQIVLHEVIRDLFEKLQDLFLEHLHFPIFLDCFYSSRFWGRSHFWKLSKALVLNLFKVQSTVSLPIVSLIGNIEIEKRFYQDWASTLRESENLINHYLGKLKMRTLFCYRNRLVRKFALFTIFNKKAEFLHLLRKLPSSGLMKLILTRSISGRRREVTR